MLSFSWTNVHLQHYFSVLKWGTFTRPLWMMLYLTLSLEMGWLSVHPCLWCCDMKFESSVVVHSVVSLLQYFRSMVHFMCVICSLDLTLLIFWSLGVTDRGVYLIEKAQSSRIQKYDSMHIYQKHFHYCRCTSSNYLCSERRLLDASEDEQLWAFKPIFRFIARHILQHKQIKRRKQHAFVSVY